MGGWPLPYLECIRKLALLLDCPGDIHRLAEVKFPCALIPEPHQSRGYPQDDKANWRPAGN